MQTPTKKPHRKTVALCIIGDEILNGRTKDKNINYLARLMDVSGYSVAEVRVIPDIEHIIIQTVHHLSQSYDYVFTSGGIGGTHDDITFSCVAKAFDLPIETNTYAFDVLSKFYQEKNLPFTQTRKNMTLMPQGCGTLKNPISLAPGAIVKNVFVCAGIPSIFQAMAQDALNHMAGGLAVFKKSLYLENIGEGTIGDKIAQFAKLYTAVSIGSYPTFTEQGFSTEIVLRSYDENILMQCYTDIKAYAETVDTIPM